jgi:DNA helicase-2/ATP-dependent DNA helicase PcrA
VDRWAIIRQRAADVLAEYERRTGRPPFDDCAGSHAHLEEIARELYQLSVVPDDELPDNVSGRLYLDEGVIGYRPAENAARRRFTVAHELGHRALEHPPREFEDSPDQIDESPHTNALAVKDGVYRAYSDRDRWELEANVFAAELLMPVERVRAMALGDPNWTVERLAAYFGVTRAAMLNQLAAALLPGPPPPTIASDTQLPDMDPSQETAATADGPALVLAGPGAGKTRVLVERFRFLVRAQGVPANRILALTFANKAAEEMRERLAALLPDEAHAIDVGTFHSLGLHLLQAYGHHLDLKPDPQPITDIDAFVLLRRRLGEVPLGNFEDLHRPTRNLRLLLQTISRAKDELCGPEEFARRVEEWQQETAARPQPTTEEEVETLAEERRRAAACADVAAVYRTYQAWLREGGYLDYGDLIAEAVRLFDLPDAARDIRERWDHILVDEFQDINYASGRLVHALDGGRGIVWAVGDPRQSIYRFRGASPVNLREFTSDYEGAEVIPLEWNYRSVEDVVKAGQAVDIPLPPGADGKPLPVAPLRTCRGRPSAEPAVELLVADTGANELAALVEGVAAEVATRPRGDAAILCRKTAQAQEISDALDAVGVPTDWGGALEERAAFKDLLGVLLLAADYPQGLVRLARLPEHHLAEEDLRRLVGATHERGRSALAVLYAAAGGEVEGLSEEGVAQAKRLKALAGALSHVATPWEALAVYLFEHAGWLRELIGDGSPAAQRRLATLGQVANLAREFGERSTLAGGSDTESFLDFLRTCLESGELGLPDEALVSSDVVHVLTVHRSKGLEWPVVFVPNLAVGRFPLGEHDPLPLPPGLLRGATDEDDALEELCLAYVAITRACDRLVLSRAERYGRGTATPAPFLQPLVDVLEPAGYLRVGGVAPTSAATRDASAAPSGEPWPLDGEVPFGALEDYEECGQRFKYTRVYGLRGEERGSLLFHRAVYAMLSWMANQTSDASPPDAAAALAYLAGYWEESGLAGHWYEGAYRRRAERVVRAFAARLGPGMRLTIRRHARLHVGSDGRAVDLTVDEEEERDGRHIYRRWHFGPPAKTHMVDNRLALFVALHRQEYGDDVPYEVRLYYPLNGLDEVVEPSARVVSNHTAKMSELIRDIEAGRFKPNRSIMRCPSCPFNLICPA